MKRNKPLKANPQKLMAWKRRSKALTANKRHKLKAGRKTKEWNEVRAELKRKFSDMGITQCELCGRSDMLSFAHRKRRRFCDREELYNVALLCVPCHESIDTQGSDFMFETINTIINERRTIR